MNLQTIPRKDKVIKRAFIPKLDALVYFDYEQIELRLLAYYMAVLGDPSMREVLISGEDLHSESAKGAFRLSREPNDAERQLGKNLNFSMVYGGGRPAVLRYLNQFYDGKKQASWGEAEKVLSNFHARWPGIAIVTATIDAELDKKGYIRTLFGRQLHPESRHKALNALVQGCAADLMRNALVTVDENLAGSESHLVNVVHDEIQIDARENEIPDLVEYVPQWMDYAEVSEVVPIGTSVEISRTTWADKEEYDLVRQ